MCTWVVTANITLVSISMPRILGFVALLLSRTSRKRIYQTNLSDMDFFHKEVKEVHTLDGPKLYTLEASAGQNHLFVWSESLGRYKVL